MIRRVRDAYSKRVFRNGGVRRSGYKLSVVCHVCHRWRFAAILLLIRSGPLFGQLVTDDMVKVVGRVVDENNTPVATVRIALRSKSLPQTEEDAVSNSAGTFSLTL